MKKLFMLTAIVGIALFSACQNHEHEKAEDTNFTITSPIQKDTSVYKEYVGQVQSASHIELRSQERGYLEKIFVDEGQFVKKGQLMFKIMPLIYEAEVEKAKAEMNFTEIEYRNTKSLRDKNIVSENELALAKAKLNKAKAELSLAQAHLGFTEIRAPFDGIMDRFHTRLGSLIEEGELLTTLSNNSKMWVYFNVPEAEYLDNVKLAKTKDAQKVYLQMANKETFDYPGFVETIEADFNNETGNIAFRATFQNPKGILRHGETGNILMPVVLKNAIIIPQKATFDVLDKKFVYIVDKNNVLKAKQITVAHELPHLYILESGLSVKDKILAEGLGKVKNNEQIKGEFVSFEKELAELNHLHAE
ncbi:efflux RND transporter periplasmic adaptor subunit [Pedobacter glucosidilyticus]|uniref:efflux RND transporter periplasmic adaptor subunit n=1 Tax=Pedobacter glucosidilyticus TaxID=1122941 RepID=UPI0026F0A501|nr:efflux RND transporter periplasmic adaptor subunit [Pedobacter glucosidilyticus]